MWKKLLVGTGLVGIGGVAGYFISKRVLEKQYRCDVAEIKALYQDKLDELDAMIEAVDEKHGLSPKKAKVEETPEEQEIADVIATYRGQRRRSIVEYNKPSLDSFKEALQEMYHEGESVVVDPDGSEHLGDIDEEDGEDIRTSDDPEYEAELDQAAEEYARRRVENMKKGEPYLIEPEEYREGPEEYEHQTLYYYADDRTLCEDDDSEVEDEEEIVGFDYEDKLDMQTTCWVRNDKLQVLYEIHRIDDSYKNAVANVSETPREREFRLQGRRKQAMDNRGR
jgi:hypothetical protein